MIPKPIYEALPAIYVAGGISIMAATGNALLFASGAALGIIGMVLLNRRRNYRLLRQRRVH